jgi:CysZ protein
MQTTGVHYLINGFKLMTKPGIKRYFVMPLIINISIFIGMFFIAKHFFAELNQWILHLLPAWLQWLKHVFWMVFFGGFFLIMIYTFVTIANIVASPFNSLLAEKVECYLTGNTMPSQNIWGDIKDIPRVMHRQLAIIGYSLPRASVLLVLFFIPVIQLAAASIWLGFSAWLMALQYVDYPTDNHKIPFSEVRKQLSQKKWLSLSFGLSVLVLSMIPVINCFIMPAAVAGATQLWLEQFNKQQSNSL